jgi:oligoribonuclease
MKSNQNLIWIDLEMTGLDPKKDRIIEIATIVTDSNLTILAEGPVLAIHQSDEQLAGMDAWNTRQHNQSGLVERVKKSVLTEQDAERLTLDFLRLWIDSGKSPMCGNSICQDKRFLCEYMPDLAAFFHYRLIDVSTVKELAARWEPSLLSGFEKKSKHLALEDVKDSIAELVYYRQHFIRTKHDKS